VIVKALSSPKGTRNLFRYAMFTRPPVTRSHQSRIQTVWRVRCHVEESAIHGRGAIETVQQSRQRDSLFLSHCGFPSRPTALSYHVLTIKTTLSMSSRRRIERLETKLSSFIKDSSVRSFKFSTYDGNWYAMAGRLRLMSGEI
jgi:hypothetical protein